MVAVSGFIRSESEKKKRNVVCAEPNIGFITCYFLHLKHKH